MLSNWIDVSGDRLKANLCHVIQRYTIANIAKKCSGRWKIATNMFAINKQLVNYHLANRLHYGGALIRMQIAQ